MTASPDLYAILGIERTALGPAIKIAYRNRAKLLHPDIAPDKEDEFRRVTMAYEVLRDKERRKKYDETGKVDSSSIDPAFKEHTEVLSLIAQMFDKALSGLKVPLEVANIIEEMKAHVTELRNDCEEQNSKMKARLGALQKLRRRIRVKEGVINSENMLIKILDGKMQPFVDGIEKNTTLLKRIARAEVELEMYDSIEEFMSSYTVSNSTTGTSTYTTWRF